MYTREELQKRRMQLPAEKLASLQQRLHGDDNDAGRQPATTITRRAHAGPAPLSFAQERLWFLYELEPDSPGYNESLTSRWRGRLDREAFQRACLEIMRRHEILRTTFKIVDDQPAQVVHPLPEDWRLPVIDLTHLPSEERLARAEELVSAERRRPFNLLQEYPWRGLLVRLAEDEHFVSLTLHHIACDGWSFGIFNSEFVKFYRAYATRQQVCLPELPIQCADYAWWERQEFNGQALEHKLAYWRRQLAGLTSLQLPTDRPRPPIITSDGATLYSHLPVALVEEVTKVGQNNKSITEFMKYLAAFKVLLHRYSGQTDIVVGSPVANRDRPELEGLIGFFLNTLVLRTDLSGDPDFLELLSRVQQTTLSAYVHQDVPVDYLVMQIPFARDPSRPPLFQVLFIWHDWQHVNPMQAITELGLEIEEVNTSVNRAKFDLSLSLERRGDGIICCWEYNTNLFDEPTIMRMADHFRILLEGIVATPEKRVSRLPLMSRMEKHRLLADWSRCQPVMGQPICASAEVIHTLFECQVGQVPDTVAVIDGGRQLTYQELNQHANQMARFLQRHGVGPETVVGISVERSLEMVVGVLAILKAGGVCLPLDPTYPRQRLALMLDDAQVTTLITQQSILEKQFSPTMMELSSPPQIVCLDRLWRQLAEQPDHDLPRSANGTNLAYLTYTSGSTSRPKGVMVTHHALTVYSQHAGQSFGLGPGEKVLQFASLGFDTAFEELFPTLITGGTLVLRDEEMLGSVAGFLAKCRTWGITVLDLPTAYWHEIVAALKHERLAWPASVRLVIIGGERALPERVQSWQTLVGPQVQLLNTYGPSEATIVATAADLGHWDEEVGREVSIGRPVGGAEVYLLDTEMEPVPVGIPGEVYIGGTGVARGYLKRPGLTAERFVPNPFAGSGSRLYRTGDLARYRVDGSIEFLGRIDNQVKIRGFRVELGEIETALVAHPAVHEAVVIAQALDDGDIRLAAFIVPAGAAHPATFEEGNKEPLSDLRHFLQEKLPAYMIPAAFIPVEAIPLTPNGKIDRRALPVPEWIRPEGLTYTAPRTPTEETIVQIWSDLLQVEKIGIHDDFFALGGHSLIAIRLFSRLRDTFQVEISLRLLFESPTVAGLAQNIETTLWLAQPPAYQTTDRVEEYEELEL